MIAAETVDRWPDWAWGMVLRARARRRARRQAVEDFAEWQDHGEPVG